MIERFFAWNGNITCLDGSDLGQIDPQLQVHAKARLQCGVQTHPRVCIHGLKLIKASHIMLITLFMVSIDE